MNELTKLPMDKRSALALIRATEKRALEEQDIWRERIASLQGKCTIKEALQRIVEMGAAEFVARLDAIHYPVTHENRRNVSLPSDRGWDDIPSDKQFPEITDREILGPLRSCSGILEHRDRLKGMAMLFELVGCDWDCSDQRQTVGVRQLDLLWRVFVGWKALQELVARAKRRDDKWAYDRYVSLVDFSRSILECSASVSAAQVAAADEMVEPESPELRKEAEEVLNEVRALCKQLAASEGTGAP